MGLEHSKSNYYLIAGLLVIIGIILLVAFCVCLMNVKRLVSVVLRHDTVDNTKENTTELQEIQPLTINIDSTRPVTNVHSHDPPLYQELSSTRV